jgi:hypothetical protein
MSPRGTSERLLTSTVGVEEVAAGLSILFSAQQSRNTGAK